MPLLRAVPVMLSAGERTLNRRVRGAKTAWRDRLRAQIVLAAARVHPNARIAAGLGITVDTVRKWRRRFAVRGLDGLAGRPRRVSAADRAAVVALACQLPAATGVPLAGSPARNWPPRWRPGGWPVPCRRPRCCGSWLSTRSGRGSTSRGSTPATRTPRPGRRSSRTCTRATTRASRSGPRTGSCPSMPGRRSMPAAARIPPCPPRPAGPSATSTSMRCPRFSGQGIQ